MLFLFSSCSKIPEESALILMSAVSLRSCLLLSLRLTYGSVIGLVCSFVVLLRTGHYKTYMGRIIISWNFADSIRSAGFLINMCDPNMCQAQAFLLQMGSLASILWSCFFGVALFNIVRTPLRGAAFRRKNKTIFVRFSILLWLSTFATGLVPALMTPSVYGPLEAWSDASPCAD